METKISEFLPMDKLVAKSMAKTSTLLSRNSALQQLSTSPNETALAGNKITFRLSSGKNEMIDLHTLRLQAAPYASATANIPFGATIKSLRVLIGGIQIVYIRNYNQLLSTYLYSNYPNTYMRGVYATLEKSSSLLPRVNVGIPLTANAKCLQHWFHLVKFFKGDAHYFPLGVLGGGILDIEVEFSNAISGLAHKNTICNMAIVYDSIVCSPELTDKLSEVMLNNGFNYSYCDYENQTVQIGGSLGTTPLTSRSILSTFSLSNLKRLIYTSNPDSYAEATGVSPFESPILFKNVRLQLPNGNVQPARELKTPEEVMAETLKNYGSLYHCNIGAPNDMATMITNVESNITTTETAPSEISYVHSLEVVHADDEGDHLLSGLNSKSGNGNFVLYCDLERSATASGTKDTLNCYAECTKHLKVVGGSIMVEQ